MDTVTYPNAQVQQELARWVLVRLDVVEQPEVAKRFEVVGVPTAVAVTADGDELGRVENFVEPGPFREKLAGFRE
jgi:thiol:disulfide interchange protein